MAKRIRLLKVIIGIIVLIVLFIIIRFLCFKVFIVPNWFSQSKAFVESVSISHNDSEIKITDEEKIDRFYDLIDKNKISKLILIPRHCDLDTSDAGYSIIFKYSDETEEQFRYGGLARRYLARDNSEKDLYWIVGSENQDLLDFIMAVTKSD